MSFWVKKKSQVGFSERSVTAASSSVDKIPFPKNKKIPAPEKIKLLISILSGDPNFFLLRVCQNPVP